MIAAGSLPENLELIRGTLVEKMPRSPLRPEQPLTLSDAEPEPDVAVIAGDGTAIEPGHPITAELQLYAEAGVRECWLVLAGERAIERHTEPQGSTYQRIERVAFPNALESTVFPGLMLPPAVLFPG